MFGPATPGVTVSSTRVVVAKSEPLAEMEVAIGSSPACSSGRFGLKPVRTAVRPKTPTAAAISTVTTRRIVEPSLWSRGIERHRLNAPSATITRATATFTNSVVPYVVSVSRLRTSPMPPASPIVRRMPVSTTTSNAQPAIRE